MATHDQLFKDLGIAFPRDLVRLTQPALAERLDLDRLDFEAREGFTDTPRGRRRQPDLVAEAWEPGAEEPALLLHQEFEHQYSLETRQRLSEYNRLLSLRSGRVVQTAVLFQHGGAPGLSRCSYPEASFGQTSCFFCYQSLGLEGAPAEEYLARPEPLAWAFAALMRPNVIGNRAELAIECLRRIAHAKLDEARTFLLLNCVRTYAVRSSPQVAREHDRLLRESHNSEVRDMFMTWADEVKNEGRQEGMRELVARLVQQRFGTLPEALQQQLPSMSPARLTALAERISRAESVDDLFLEPAS